MIVISARSPYQIIINEASQIGSKVELFIWNKGTTEPTIPTYVMSENIASVTQTETNYNISPFILEYIKQISVNYSTSPVVESNNDWCLVRVKRYKKTSGGTFTLLDNLVYMTHDRLAYLYYRLIGGKNGILLSENYTISI
jgi:hypothetical protein